MEKTIINVIGAGLAGSEAAYQLARRGYQVRLYEMRPVKMTPAHKTSGFAELICSNSLRGASLEKAVECMKNQPTSQDASSYKEVIDEWLNGKKS